MAKNPTRRAYGSLQLKAGDTTRRIFLSAITFSPRLNAQNTIHKQAIGNLSILLYCRITCACNKTRIFNLATQIYSETRNRGFRRGHYGERTQSATTAKQNDIEICISCRCLSFYLNLQEDWFCDKIWFCLLLMHKKYKGSIWPVPMCLAESRDCKRADWNEMISWTLCK